MEPRPGTWRPWLVALSLFAATTGHVAAESLRYEIEVPEGQATTHSVEVEVRDAGRLRVRAEWSGSRALALRLVPPHGGAAARRRAGRSPLVLDAAIAPRSNQVGTWTVQLRAVAARGAVRGTLVVELPEPPAPSPSPAPRPDAVRRVVPTEAPPPRPVAAPEPPTLPAWEPFFAAVERYRAEIRTAGPEAQPDSCHWQAPLLSFLAARRETLRGGQLPVSSTRDLLLDLSNAVEAVEALRSTRDPAIAGPAPADPERSAAWRRARAERFTPIENQLDRLLVRMQRDHAPELDGESWPTRFVSCLMACERHFEERGRLGVSRAAHGEMAEQQWPALRLAAQALAAFAGLPTTAPAAR